MWCHKHKSLCASHTHTHKRQMMISICLYECIKFYTYMLRAYDEIKARSIQKYNIDMLWSMHIYMVNMWESPLFPIHHQFSWHSRLCRMLYLVYILLQNMLLHYYTYMYIRLWVRAWVSEWMCMATFWKSVRRCITSTLFALAYAFFSMTLYLSI